ncbi:MAG TPA: peroxiredoxin family protein [Draconibacterium sp.]|nr:peroxiredoxin family protein [Draconibacterium sp.]HRX12101.1 peroxiredoxin family protein [Draconibacterium sp.]
MKRIVLIVLIFISIQSFAQDFTNIAVGEKATDFKLKTIQGNDIQLSELLKSNSVVLIVLRGWPGYQCPICTKQVGGLISDADEFSELKTVVLMVYPGPSDDLQNHAKEFTEDFNFPDNFYFAIDPDYSMINKYGLRWDAPKETAYPSTFVISKNGEIVFSKISTTHGGRADNEEIFEALGKL